MVRVLEEQEKGAGGEIQLTDAMARMIGDQPFHGLTFDGRRFDCGDKACFIQANIALALESDDIGPAVRAFVTTEIAQSGPLLSPRHLDRDPGVSD